MSHRVVITGAGVVSPLGASPQALHQALCDGRTAAGPVTLFPDSELPPVEAAEIADFDAATYLEGNLRPLDRSSKLSTSAAALALQASGHSTEGGRGESTGLVLGSMFGSIHTISEFDRRGLTAGPAYVKPLVFANTVISAAAGQTAIRLGLRGVNTTVAGGSTSSLQALGYATDLIRTGRNRAVVAGGVEELSPEALIGLWKAGRLAGSPSGARARAIPFGEGRNGFVLAESAAMTLLEPEERARERGATLLATILGAGQSNDPSSGPRPGDSAAALRRAIDSALQEAGLEAAHIDCVFASAAGGPAEDAAEAAAIHGVLGDGVPVSAIKSMTGEALGASGALQVVAALESLRTGKLPGTAGLDTMDPALERLAVSPMTAAHEMSVALVTSLAFDGPAAALILAKETN